MTHSDDPIEQPYNRLRHLRIAGAMLFFALLVYLLLDNLRYVDTSAVLTAFYTILVLLLLIFVSASLFFLVCYANERLGRAVAQRLQYASDIWRVPMHFLGFGGFKVESAMDEKRMASRRLRHRHERHRYARESKRARGDG